MRIGFSTSAIISPFLKFSADCDILPSHSQTSPTSGRFGGLPDRFPFSTERSLKTRAMHLTDFLHKIFIFNFLHIKKSAYFIFIQKNKTAFSPLKPMKHAACEGRYHS
jgi:hypothetical protein